MNSIISGIVSWLGKSALNVVLIVKPRSEARHELAANMQKDRNSARKE